VSDFTRCRVCGHYDYASRHHCPPRFEARVVDWGDDEWREVFARDMEAAAVRFCANYDPDFEYSIIKAGCATLEVRGDRNAKGQFTPARRFSIAAETVPEYRAREITPTQKDTKDG
jgi:hypothetical protein